MSVAERAFTGITREPLTERPLTEFVTTPESGGIVVFAGVVRNRHAGRTVLRIEYVAVEELARVKLAEIADEVLRDAGVHRVAAVHRLGLLQVGEASVLVAASAGHREEAFAAARRLIDRVKEVLPVWKHEHFADGSIEWAPGFTVAAADRVAGKEARTS